MKKFRREFKLMMMFSFVLTIITVVTNIDMDSSAKVGPTASTTDSHEVVDLMFIQKRRPASTNEGESLSIYKEFFCDKSSKKTSDKIKKNMVIVNFRFCNVSSAISSISLENVSNGFKAHVFKVEENKFKTDYIQLNNGINLLKLEAVLKDGQKIEESLEILSGS